MPVFLTSILCLAGVFGLAAALRAFRAFVTWLDRGRIAQQLEQSGGTLMDMAQLFRPIEWLFTEGNVRRYRITYRDYTGELVTTECLISAATGAHYLLGAEHATRMEAITIYMPLLDEGTDLWRPVLAHALPDGAFRIVADQPYDTDNEHWQFPPGSVVRCRDLSFSNGEQELAAFELVHSFNPAA